MDSYKLFSGRAYTFDLNKEIKSGSTFDLIKRILDNCSQDIVIEQIIEIEGNENYDEYKLITDSKLYNLKISLDVDCVLIKKEVDFLKNNKDSIKSNLLPKYYNSGIVRVGLPVLFLLTSFEEAFSLEDVGLSTVIDNLNHFFFCLHNFGKLTSSNNEEDYLDLCFKSFSPQEDQELFKDKLSVHYSLDKIMNIFSALKEEAYENKKYISGETTCHGLLSRDNLLTRDSFFKFKNLYFNFRGSVFFDLCFAFVSLGISSRERAIGLKLYSDKLGIDTNKYKNEINGCIKACSCIYFSKLIFDYLIEENLFNNKRPEKVLSIIYRYTSSHHYFANLNCYSSISKITDKLLLRQVKK